MTGLVERLNAAGIGDLGMKPTAIESMLQHLNAIYYRDLRLCGCGDPDAALALVHKLLRAHADRCVHAAAQELMGDDAVRQIVLGTLDAARLVEHGTSSLAGWLTDKGEWMLAAMDLLDGKPVTDLWDAVFVGLPHDGGDCSDSCWVRT